MPEDANGWDGEGVGGLRKRGRESYFQPRNFDIKFPFGVVTCCLYESTRNKQNGSGSHPESEYSGTLTD